MGNSTQIVKRKVRAMREDIFIPVHRTRILPLRYLANYLFHPISMIFFRIGLRANYQIYESGEGYTIWDELKEKIGFRLYNFFDKPYSKWGTTYIFDKNCLDDLGGSEWNDYDENGIPYWYYLWHEDPITGDAWRLVLK